MIIIKAKTKQQIMAIKINPKPLIITVAVILGGLGLWKVSKMAHKASESQTIGNVSLANISNNDNQATVSVKTPVPEFDNAVATGAAMNFQVMAWNSQFGIMFANGGANTSKGSLFQAAGLKVHIDRQDNCDKTVAAFVKNSKELHEGTTQSPLLVFFMADGVPGYSAGLNEVRKWHSAAKVIDFCGRSAGEDCFYGPAAWVENPKLALGHCVVGVERDGDMNIFLQWAASNGLPVNFDDTKFDSNAVNVIGVGDFNMGDATTIGLVPTVLSNKAMNRQVISHGKTIPGVTHDCYADAFATWTPADQAVLQGRKGFARIASTKEYAAQMPNAIIIDSIWAAQHDSLVVKMIVAIGKAGDQVKSFDDAKVFAAKVSAKVYGEKDANYWLKFYNGDKVGDIEVGGSRAFNLADAANMFGLGKDDLDKYKITYETFQGILTKGYPEKMKGCTPYELMVDKHYLQEALDGNVELKNGKTEDDNTTYASGNIVTNAVSTKKYPIQFANNSSVLDPHLGQNASILKDIFNNAVIAKTQTVFIVGHTNRTGDEQHNIDLSKARAAAIEKYLHDKSPSFFNDDNHIQTSGAGSNNAPVQPDTDPANRCVIVTIGS